MQQITLVAISVPFLQIFAQYILKEHGGDVGVIAAAQTYMSACCVSDCVMKK